LKSFSATSHFDIAENADILASIPKVHDQRQKLPTTLDRYEQHPQQIPIPTLSHSTGRKAFSLSNMSQVNGAVRFTESKDLQLFPAFYIMNS
jgi:hypothetical protein